MNDIKLPVKWLREKGVMTHVGDAFYNDTMIFYKHIADPVTGQLDGNHLFITSFAWRVGVHFDAASLPIEVVSRPLKGATKWRPDAKTLMEMYTAEQRAKAIADTYTTSASVNLDTYTVTGSNYSMPIDNPMVVGCSDNITNGDETEYFFLTILNEETNQASEFYKKPKKETKLKLTKEDVGKKFEDRFEQVYKIQLCTDSDVAVTDNDGHIFVCDYDGVFENAITNQLIKRHEPRYWLKDLPDADLFTYDWIACDENGEWYNYEYSPPILSDVAYGAGGGGMFCMACIKDLPKLTGDEWKLSKITIDDLRVWQKENK